MDDGAAVFQGLDDPIIGIAFENKRERRGKGANVKWRACTKLLGCNGRHRPCARIAGQLLEDGVFVDIGTQTALHGQAANADDAEIGSDLLQLANGCGVERSSNRRVDPPANHDELDTFMPGQFCGDCRRVGDNGQFMGQQMSGYGQIGGARIKKNRHAVLDQRGCCLAKSGFTIRHFGKARLEWYGGAGRQQGATIDALALATRCHFAQIPPDRIFRDAKIVGEFLRKHATILAELG